MEFAVGGIGSGTQRESASEQGRANIPIPVRIGIEKPGQGSGCIAFVHGAVAVVIEAVASQLLIRRRQERA